MPPKPQLPTRLRTISAVFVLLFAAVGWWILQQSTASNDVKPFERPKPLVGEEYIQARDSYVALVSTNDAKVALLQLRRDAQNDDRLAGSCYSIAHYIGYAAYEQYESFTDAARYQDSVCNSGYIHGVIESHFLTVEDIEQEIVSLCGTGDDYLAWQCHHGTGHGAMFYTSANLAESIRLCELKTSQFGSQACANGVYMENFGSVGGAHESQYINYDSPQYPCKSQPDDYKTDCYLYAPTLLLAQEDVAISEVGDWCMKAESNYRQHCMSGIGTQIAKEHISDLSYAQAACDQVPYFRDACIEGAAGLLVFHYGELEAAKAACSQLKNTDLCQETIMQFMFLFDS